jgi:mercuric ion transport protein
LSVCASSLPKTKFERFRSELLASECFLGYGYWLVYQSSKLACPDGEVCARPLPNRLVKSGLILATILVVAALGFNFVAALFLDS